MSEPKASEDLRPYVRQHYGEIAENFSPSAPAACCSSATSSCCNSESQLIQFYDAADVASLPFEIAGLSLGCGDPVTLAELEPGQTVLDLGSGGGIDCFLAARQVGPGGRVIGVDMTPRMLEKARANKERLGADHVEFRLGEIEHLPVADASVDVIISNCVINLSPDKSQVLREAYRVLKPGGRLAISDMVTDGPLPEAIKSNPNAWAACLAGAPDRNEYIRLIQEAGFSNVQLTPVSLALDALDTAPGLIDENLDNPSATGKQVTQAVFSARITAIRPI
jgi:ubiquinone/menaquinone biosynthesis C-methylase UbiE